MTCTKTMSVSTTLSASDDHIYASPPLRTGVVVTKILVSPMTLALNTGPYCAAVSRQKESPLVMDNALPRNGTQSGMTGGRGTP
jgi:hypothetical protein